jgi:hypothetical protein
VKRRPSAALIVALLALFVALGGPAHAQRLLGKGDVDSRVVKDRSLKTRDLSKRTVRELRTTPNGTVTEAKIRNGAVTPGKLAPAAVTAPAIADSAVGGAQVANGSLSAADVGRFWGRFRSTIGPIPIGKCWSGEPAGLPPDLASADISQDIVLVQPDDRFLERRLTFSVRASANRSRFTLAACNLGIPIDGGGLALNVDAFEVSFRYVVIDLP